MPPFRFQAIRAPKAEFNTDLFEGRIGAITDGPMGEHWGWWDGETWRYAAYSDALGNTNAKSVATGGTVRIEEDGDGIFKDVTGVSFTENGQLLSAKYSPVLSGNVTSRYHSADRDWGNLTDNPFAGLTPSNMPTVTREAIIQPLPITNSAPGVVTVVSGGVKSFGFDGGASTEELFYHLDTQHDYIAGTDMIFHVHWIPATGAGGNVKWQIEYQWVEAGTVWPAPTAASVVTAAGTTAWADLRTDITLPGAGHTYNSRLLIRLFRNPADAADTYAGDAVLTSVGLHYSANPGQP